MNPLIERLFDSRMENREKSIPPRIRFFLNERMRVVFDRMLGDTLYRVLMSEYDRMLRELSSLLGDGERARFRDLGELGDMLHYHHLDTSYLSGFKDGLRYRRKNSRRLRLPRQNRARANRMA